MLDDSSQRNQLVTVFEFIKMKLKSSEVNLSDLIIYESKPKDYIVKLALLSKGGIISKSKLHDVGGGKLVSVYPIDEIPGKYIIKYHCNT